MDKQEYKLFCYFKDTQLSPAEYTELFKRSKECISTFTKQIRHIKVNQLMSEKECRN